MRIFTSIDDVTGELKYNDIPDERVRKVYYWCRFVKPEGLPLEKISEEFNRWYDSLNIHD
jgi:hypothetical protein